MEFDFELKHKGTLSHRVKVVKQAQCPHLSSSVCDTSNKKKILQQLSPEVLDCVIQLKNAEDSGINNEGAKSHNKALLPELNKC